MRSQQPDIFEPTRYKDETPGYSKTRAVTTLCHEVARLAYRGETERAEDLLAKLTRRFPERSPYIAEMVATYLTEFNARSKPDD